MLAGVLQIVDELEVWILLEKFTSLYPRNNFKKIQRFERLLFAAATILVIPLKAGLKQG
jgi:hypothetical protein